MRLTILILIYERQDRLEEAFEIDETAAKLGQCKALHAGFVKITTIPPPDAQPFSDETGDWLLPGGTHVECRGMPEREDYAAEIAAKRQLVLEL